MNHPFLRRSNIVWKILGIVIITFITLTSFFFKAVFLEQYHAEIMLVAFLLVMLLCGLLFSDVLKVIGFQQEKIEGLMGIKLSLISLIDLKDSYTEGHSTHVRDLARRFAEYLKLSSMDIEEIATAAELHDIGKIGVPDSILTKKGKLNEDEFLEIKKHPSAGAAAVESIKGFYNVAKIIRNHHERYDGNGYPDGLAAEKIPFGSKILTIIDAFDAMSYSRPYREAMPRKEIFNTLEQGMGTQFDPPLVRAFFKFVQQNYNDNAYDLVCGMAVNLNDSFFKFFFKNKTYTFCSDVCLKEFEKFPQKYLNEIQEKIETFQD